eukprot:gene19145-biopygen19025
MIQAPGIANCALAHVLGGPSTAPGFTGWHRFSTVPLRLGFEDTNSGPLATRARKVTIRTPQKRFPMPLVSHRDRTWHPWWPGARFRRCRPDGVHGRLGKQEDRIPIFPKRQGLAEN